MLEKNYTNEADRGRFGFSESGIFRSPFKSETLLIIIFTAVFIVGTLGGLLGAVSFIRLMNETSPEGTNLMFYGIVATIIVFGAAALSFTVFKVGTAYTKRGFKCTYSATEEVFTAKIGGSVHTIKYGEVTSVKFTPRSIRGKIHGYDIDVVLGNRTEQFSLTFDGNFQSEKTTPFYIIKERMELIKNRRVEEAIKLDRIKSCDFRAVKPAEAVEEKPVPLIDEMPAVSAAGNAAKSPENPRISPTVEGYALENSRISEGERLKSLTDMEQIKRSRELDEKEIVAQGSFYLGCPDIAHDICFIVMTLIILVDVFVLCSFLQSTFEAVISPAFWGSLITSLVILTIIWIFLKGGHDCKYSANAREFSFFRKDGKGGVAHFFYKDILSIDYCPHKLLWYDTGYFVTIETKSGFFTYKYNFPRFRHIMSIEKLPFEPIRERIDPSIDLPEQQSVRLAFSKKKLAVHFVEAIACLALGVYSIFKAQEFDFSRAGIFVTLEYYVLFPALAVFGIVLLLRRIRKGDEYRCRADNREFIIRRANGTGKTIRIPLEEITDIRFKRRIFTAVVKIKTKTKTLKFNYVLPRIFKKAALEETPFGVLTRKG